MKDMHRGNQTSEAQVVKTLELTGTTVFYHPDFTVLNTQTAVDFKQQIVKMVNESTNDPNNLVVNMEAVGDLTEAGCIALKGINRELKGKLIIKLVDPREKVALALRRAEIPFESSGL